MLLGLLPGIALAGTTAMAAAVIIESIRLDSSTPYWKKWCQFSDCGCVRL